MGWFFAAIGGAVGFGLSGFSMKFATQKASDSKVPLLLGLYTSGTICFVITMIARGQSLLDWRVLLAGLIIGLGQVNGNDIFVRALKVGPASLTAPLANANTILVIAMSLIFFNESLVLNEVLGVGLIIGAASLLPIDPSESLSIKDRIWYAFIALAIGLFFFRTGGLKIVEEIGLANTPVLLIAYAVGIPWFGARFARRQPEPCETRIGLMSGLVGGLFSFAGIQLYALALETGPASIVAPIFSANGLILAVLSITLLGERLSRLQAIALIGIVAGLVVIRI